MNGINRRRPNFSSEELQNFTRIANAKKKLLFGKLNIVSWAAKERAWEGVANELFAVTGLQRSTLKIKARKLHTSLTQTNGGEGDEPGPSFKEVNHVIMTSTDDKILNMICEDAAGDVEEDDMPDGNVTSSYKFTKSSDRTESTWMDADEMAQRETDEIADFVKRRIMKHRYDGQIELVNTVKKILDEQTKLVEIEAERLGVDSERLRIEQERLRIDEERLVVEKSRLELEQRKFDAKYSISIMDDVAAVVDGDAGKVFVVCREDGMRL